MQSFETSSARLGSIANRARAIQRAGETYIILLQDFCSDLDLRPGETIRVADFLITAPCGGKTYPHIRPAEPPISTDLQHLAENLAVAS